ncbi:hypothetical protein HPB47_011007 [Ixodes persulcatus]|uniref:Uncharacterized protein n=1 Tax=Ixodes persulcatus TaxID=34615 RepID=A0AC60NYC2_IXOPE|nr:hypothetical protein HPB47_011007 [Ixodes persulcatus]
MNSAARKRVGSVGVLTPEERLGKMVTKQKSMDDVLSELRGNAKFLSFGKRSGGTGRRMNECLILEPSEMVVPLEAGGGRGQSRTGMAGRNFPSFAMLIVLRKHVVTTWSRAGEFLLLTDGSRERELHQNPARPPYVTAHVTRKMVKELRGAYVLVRTARPAHVSRMDSARGPE